MIATLCLVTNPNSGDSANLATSANRCYTIYKRKSQIFGDWIEMLNVHQFMMRSSIYDWGGLLHSKPAAPPMNASIISTHTDVSRCLLETSWRSSSHSGIVSWTFETLKKIQRGSNAISWGWVRETRGDVVLWEQDVHKQPKTSVTLYRGNTEKTFMFDCAVWQNGQETDQDKDRRS